MTGPRITPEITRAMVELYDRFTHVDLDRRALIEGLTRLAGSGAAAASVLTLLQADAAQAGVIAADDARIMAEPHEWTAAGVAMRGYLVRPKKARKKAPGVLVIHENRGLNEHIRDVARRVAVAGYTALAPDFLSVSGGTPADEDAARAAIGKLDVTATVQQGVETLAHLAKLSTKKVGAVGFCWGGGMVNRLAIAAGDGLAAGVSYYGPAPSDPAQVAKIRAAMLLHYAGLDERINAGIPAYDAALKAVGVRHAIQTYPGVNHAFNNDTSAARYDKAAADLAWQRTLDWFAKALR